jgi:hypothetical protein
MFLGLVDPDPLVRDVDPDPDLEHWLVVLVSKYSAKKCLFLSLPDPLWGHEGSDRHTDMDNKSGWWYWYAGSVSHLSGLYFPQRSVSFCLCQILNGGTWGVTGIKMWAI